MAKKQLDQIEQSEEDYFESRRILWADDTVFSFYGDSPLMPGEISSKVTDLILKSNQPILPGAIPKNVRYIKFEELFNQPLRRGDIPSSVRELDFDFGYTQPLRRGSIPSSVKKLCFLTLEIPLTRQILPSSLTHLSCYSSNSSIPVNIPESVRKLDCNIKFMKSLQENAESIVITHLTLQIDDNEIFKATMIPSSATHFSFGWKFNRSLNPAMIPLSITHLTFGSLFNQILNVGDIPSSVTHLTFGDYFNQPLLPGVIPSSVTHLTFGNRFYTLIDVDTNTKIKCHYDNFTLFLRKEFKSIRFYLNDTVTTDLFNGKYLTSYTGTYSIKKTKIKDQTRVLLKLVNKCHTKSN